MILVPSAWAAKILHYLMASPLICIVHAPHCAVSQPMCVPVSFSASLKKSTSNTFAFTFEVCFFPFISMDKDIDIFSPHLDNVLLLPVDANQDRYNRQLKITFVEKKSHSNTLFSAKLCVILGF